MLERFIDEGVDVVRLNMSHGTLDDHQQTLEALRAVITQRGVHVAIVADLCGPKVRTGMIDPNRADIAAGDVCTIVSESIVGTAKRFSTTYPGFVNDVRVGERVLIDDGVIRLRVTKKRDDEITCTCEVGGTIGNRKGVNVPDSDLSLPALTDKDRRDLAWAVENDVDYVALSFVRQAEDIELLREAMDGAGRQIPIIAKIETPQAIGALDAIIRTSDAALVARGDLGVEMDVWLIPILQKDMVRRCRRLGKPVIIATQMLHSMVLSPTPTRAEVSDVANAVLDGADAVMLSAESAVGRYPLESIAMMNRIARQAHDYRHGPGIRRGDIVDEQLRVGHEIDQTRSAVARSSALIAHDLGAKLIAVWCYSGTTARWISKYQARQPLVGLSADQRVCNQLSLCYGLEPMLVPPEFAAGAAPWRDLEPQIATKFALDIGDVIMVVGDPTHPERASTLSIHIVRERADST